MKIIIGIVLVIALVVGGFFILNTYIYNEKQADTTASSPRDATYVIDGIPVTLNDGVAEKEAAPGSHTKIVTRYFGNDVAYDFDGDGRQDIAFLLTQDMGGSGVFYYAAAALNKEQGYEGSQALFLGDRISPQSTTIDPKRPGVVVVNYTDRRVGEDFGTPPSVGKSIWLKLDPSSMQFGEVAQDFEGEADPSHMSLDMKKWVWVRAEYNDGTVVTPKRENAFSLTFEKKGRFSATTDCNSMSGNYHTDQSVLTFSDIAMTKMYCEGSQETEFAKILEHTGSYLFTSKGELILEIKFDSGTVTFR